LSPSIFRRLSSRNCGIGGEKWGAENKEETRGSEQMLEVDVAIIGGGFGGSLLALVLRRADIRVALIDKGRHPRFAIGESSTPIANLVLRDLCREYELPRVAPLAKYGTWQAAHPHLVSGIKRGFSYFHHEAGQPFEADADHSTELLVAASSSDQHSDTHWLRQDVDGFLFEEARASGAICFEECEVGEIAPVGHVFDVPLTHGHVGSVPHAVRTRFVVDASGEGAFLAKQLKIENRTHDLHTNSRAVFAHFADVTRWKRCLETRGFDTAEHPFDCDHAALHHVFEDGWMWQLRFNDETVSAGFVQDLNHAERPKLSASEEWDSWLRRYPSVGEQFANAKIVRPEVGLRSTGRLQRKLARAAGAWWAMLPNTAGFIDALHSSGIAHTLCGIERLARILIRSLGRDDLESRLREYERCVLGEVELIDLLVSGCFAALDEFRRFAAATMLYFAAATSYERARCACVGEFQPGFLLANDPTWLAVVRRMCGRLREVDDVGQFEHELAAAIRPFNVVGLCDPALRNMYRHSALPE
jgi:FADH2 O2-dependent halogenase